MIFENGYRIVFAGDSVTDMGSNNPVGEGLFDNLGKGYVRMIENLLVACYPEVSLRITNSGISGNTSRDLLARFDRDVVDLKPDWVSICIGINDVWRQFDSPYNPYCSITPENYEANLRKIIEKCKEQGVKGIFMLTPYYMEPNRQDPMRARMDEYVAIYKRLAEEYGCELVDFQKLYEEYFSVCHSSIIAWDRVHPNEKGATLMAREFLKHCDFDFNHDFKK
jgi:lysophospholipase L1-like esterase